MMLRFLGFGLLLIAGLPGAQLAAQVSAPSFGGWTRTHSIRGSVRLFPDGAPIANIRVVLAVFPEQAVATAFTPGSGDFEFAHLPDGEYQILIDDPTYGFAREPVTVRSGSVRDVQIFLRGTARTRSALAGSTVSLRELSLKRKAREAMIEGLNLLYKQSDYRGSLKQFERAVQEDPRYYEAYAQIGVAHMYLQDFSSAEAALRKALDLSGGTYAESCFLLATLLSNTKRFSEAEQFARQAVDLEPERWQAHFELARAVLKLDRLDEAMQGATTAARLQPDADLVHLLFADIHAARNDLPALRDALDSYPELAPESALADRVRSLRDQIRAALGETHTAVQPAPSFAGDQNR